jgi:hypothetical protein
LIERWFSEHCANIQLAPCTFSAKWLPDYLADMGEKAAK